MEKQLKAICKKRFGSTARFARLIGRHYYDFQLLFAGAKKKMTPERKQQFKELIELAKKTVNRPLPDEDLTQELRDKIRVAIDSKFGSVGKFCEQHPAFSSFSIWQVLNGRRKTISQAVKRMLKILEINPNEKTTEKTLA